MATEVGVGYVRLIPSMRGFGAAAAKGMRSGLVPPAAKIGGEAGDKIGDGIGDGVGRSKGRLSGAAGRVGNIFKKALGAAGVAGALLLSAGLANGLQVEDAKAKLSASLGGGKWADDAGDIAGRLYMGAFGDSITDTTNAVKKVFQAGLVPPDATNAQLESMTERTLMFADVMDQDLGMATEAVSNMIRTGIARDGRQAFDILTRGIQKGTDRSGDLLVTFKEYSVQLQALGLNGSESMGLISQGLKAGAREADTVADALKEIAIKAKDGKKESAEAFNLLGLSADELAGRFAQGGDAAKSALGEVLTSLRDLDDAGARNTAATGLFGTKAEDLQGAMFALDLSKAQKEIGGVEGATADLASAYDTAQTSITSFKRKALDKLTTFVGGSLIPAFQEIAPQLKEAFAPLGPVAADLGPKLAAGLADLAPILVTLIALITPLAEVVLGLVGVFADAPAPVQKTVLGLALLAGTVGPATRAFKAVSSGASATVSGFKAVSGAAKSLRFGRLASGAGKAAGSFGRIGLAAGKAAGQVALAGLKMAASAAATAGRVIVSTAVQVAKWVWLGVQSLIHAAKVAVAWLISLGPIALVAAAVVAITVLIIKNWDKIAAFVSAAAQRIWGAVKSAFDWVRNNWPLLLGIITGPIGWAVIAISKNWETIKNGFTSVKNWVINGLIGMAIGFVRFAIKVYRAARNAQNWVISSFKAAFNWVGRGVTGLLGWFARLPGRVGSVLRSIGNQILRPFKWAFGQIRKAWNSTVGGFGFSVPSFVPKVGGKSFKIPKMHSGGIVGSGHGGAGAIGGGERHIIAQDGEGVFTKAQMAALGSAPPARANTSGGGVIISAGGLDRALLEWLRKAIRVEGGGSVQTALGQ